jgi:hypothetical protein
MPVEDTGSRHEEEHAGYTGDGLVRGEAKPVSTYSSPLQLQLLMIQLVGC